jgi:hypothetical protein
MIAGTLGLSERAADVRTMNPKLCLLVNHVPFRYNENVEIFGLDVTSGLRTTPRLADLYAGRLGYTDVVAEAARRKLAAIDRKKLYGDR